MYTSRKKNVLLLFEENRENREKKREKEKEREREMRKRERRENLSYDH